MRRLGVVAGVIVFGAADFGGMAQAQQPDALLGWMDKIAQKELDAREAAIANIKTRSEAEARKKLVRERLLKIMVFRSTKVR